MENGKICEQNGIRFIMYKDVDFHGKQQEYLVKMRSYQIPFFSVGEHVLVDKRTGYCLRYEQKSSHRYSLSLDFKT